MDTEKQINSQLAVQGDEYHNHPPDVITSSSLRDFLKSPHYYYNRYVARILPGESTESLSFGTAFHHAVLEPQLFNELYYSDPFRGNTKQSKQLAADFPGKIRLTQHSYELCTALAKIAWNHPTAQEECSHGTVERPVQAKLKNGLTVKCKPDLINELGVYDLKSLGKPLNMFSEHAFSLSYHIQAAFYTGVLFGAKEQLHRDFNFWVVTKRQPYQCGFFRIPWEECMNVWKEVCIPALNDLAKFLKSDEWAEDSRGSIDKTIHIPAKLTRYKYDNGNLDKSSIKG